jgi:PAS domain S-box-containing protein
VGVLAAVLAAAIRLQFLEVLELRAAFLTFYPAVAVAALYGGLEAGLLATAVSAALADYFWMEPVGSFGITNPADLLSVGIFLASCVLISYLAEAAFRAQARAHKAEEQSRLAAERKRAEVLLQRQAELLHLSYDAIIVWQLGGCIENWNKGAEELYGYSQEEAVGQVTHDLLKTIHPEPWPQIEAKLRERKFWEGELKHRTRDGLEVIVSARHQLVRGADGVERVLETNRDITEGKLAEEALRESEERFQVTLSSIGDAVVATDACGNVSFLNPIAVTLTGWQSEDAFGQPIRSVFRIINEKTREPAENIVDRVLSDGCIVNLANHTALITREGREIPIEDSAAPIKDSTGKVIGVVLVFHDVTEKRRAREALRESEERLRLFIEHAPASLAMFDHEMRYLSASRRWLTDYNLEQTDLSGLSHYEVFPEIPEYWKDVHRRGLAGEVVGADADRFDRADGSVQWLRWEVRPWYGAAGDVGGIVIFTEDITERQLLLEKIESVARFPDENPSPVLRISSDGKLLYANKSSAALLKSSGWKPGETLPDDWKQHALQTFSSGCSKEMELACEEVVYSLLLVPVSDLGYLNVYGRDITDRKLAMAALLESRAKLEAALASMTDAVFISDAKGHFIDFNDAFATFHRFRSKDECSRTFAEYPDILDVFMSNGEPAPLYQWAVPRALRGETVANAEYTLRRKDTGETWVGSYSFGPIRDKDGRIVGSVVAGRDITEQKRMEEELRKSRDELELRVQERTAALQRSNQALQDFASIASHDLQEPLRKVTAFSNMLKQKCGGSLEERGLDYLERILSANQRMQSLLTALLEYSRLSTKTNPFVEVNLSDLTGEVLSDLEIRIIKTGGEVHVGDLPIISADPTQMRQLFQNLIGNALKFHKPGEKPLVQVRSVSNTDSGYRIVVEDNGIGFEEKYLERIFAPFQRLHGRSEYEGTGMGLAICKKIVERHGGSITATSTPGKGSLFIIDLPARQAGL